MPINHVYDKIYLDFDNLTCYDKCNIKGNGAAATTPFINLFFNELHSNNEYVEH